MAGTPELLDEEWIRVVGSRDVLRKGKVRTTLMGDWMVVGPLIMSTVLPRSGTLWSQHVGACSRDIGRL
jgi:hypothetical protein